MCGFGVPQIAPPRQPPNFPRAPSAPPPPPLTPRPRRPSLSPQNISSVAVAAVPKPLADAGKAVAATAAAVLLGVVSPP